MFGGWYLWCSLATVIKLVPYLAHISSSLKLCVQSEICLCKNPLTNLHLYFFIFCFVKEQVRILVVPRKSLLILLVMQNSSDFFVFLLQMGYLFTARLELLRLKLMMKKV